MGTQIAGDDEAGKACSQAAEQLAFAAEEIKTAADFARFMTGVMAALLKRQIDSATATAICGTANTMLKAIEMQVKYGSLNKDKEHVLYLTAPSVAAAAPEVTHVTPRPRTVTKPAVSQKSDIPPERNKKLPWCADCYVGRKQYITATEEIDEEPLCLACYNERRKELEEDL